MNYSIDWDGPGERDGDDMIIKKMTVNGQQVEHFFNCFGHETFDLDDAVEYSIAGRLWQLSVDDVVVIDVG